MSDENENGNENAHTDSVLTVAEAAERLNVTIPRLRRMLSRPDFAAQVHQQERQTRTGTRTSTVIPDSVLVSLKAAFESGEPFPSGDKAEREHEREQEQKQIPNGNPALVEALQSEVEFLRSRLEAADVEKSELRRLMMADKSELNRLREQLAIAAPVVEAPPVTPEAPQDKRNTIGVSEPAQSRSKPWWKRLFGEKD